MKEMIKYGVILTIVGIIASASLAWINKITRPQIIAQQQIKFNQGLYEVLPGSENGVILAVQENGNAIAHKGFANPDTTDLIGYAFQADGSGYSSIIKTLVGIDTSGTILAIKVLSQAETPGLGTKCEEIRSGESSPWFQEQFKGKKAHNITIDDIEILTGATITSRAITDAVADSASSLIKKLDTLKVTE